MTGEHIMRPTFLIALGATLVISTPPASAQRLDLETPLDYQVVQRSTGNRGELRVTGRLSFDAPPTARLEARLHRSDEDSAWSRIEGVCEGSRVRGSVTAPAGGWWVLEVRVMQEEREIARGIVPHVGVGEVFVVAGQSNSANHGERKQVTRTGRVSSFDGSTWRIADDPQPGASGDGGSFMPPLGDGLVERLDVPVGFVACGIGATSVREWLPKGVAFPAPPTIESRVERLPDGTWASKGEAYDAFVARMRSMGPRGFRAVLWHQGESDANQRDTSRTLPGLLYREYLGRLIGDSRRDIGWDVPWFVAQATYHVPGDEGSDDIRSAQASLWRDGLALEGPDSDALKGNLREGDGRGVHFSDQGLRAHAARWLERLLPWLEQQAPGEVGSGVPP